MLQFVSCKTPVGIGGYTVVQTVSPFCPPTLKREERKCRSPQAANEFDREKAHFSSQLFELTEANKELEHEWSSAMQVFKGAQKRAAEGERRVALLEEKLFSHAMEDFKTNKEFTITTETQLLWEFIDPDKSGRHPIPDWPTPWYVWLHGLKGRQAVNATAQQTMTSKEESDDDFAGVDP